MCLVPQTRSTIYVFADFVYGTASHYIAQAIYYLKPFSLSLPSGYTASIHHRAQQRPVIFISYPYVYFLYLCLVDRIHIIISIQYK